MEQGKRKKEKIDVQGQEMKNRNSGFTSFYEITKAAGGLGMTGTSQDVIKVAMSHDKKSGKSWLSWSIGVNVMGHAGLEPGDKVDVLIGREKKLGLIKKSEEGWKLGKLQNGKYSGLGMRWHEGMIRVNKTTTLEHEVKDGNIEFKLPE